MNFRFDLQNKVQLWPPIAQIGNEFQDCFVFFCCINCNFSLISSQNPMNLWKKNYFVFERISKYIKGKLVNFEVFTMWPIFIDTFSLFEWYHPFLKLSELKFNFKMDFMNYICISLKSVDIEIGCSNAIAYSKRSHFCHILDIEIDFCFLFSFEANT